MAFAEAEKTGLRLTHFGCEEGKVFSVRCVLQIESAKSEGLTGGYPTRVAGNPVQVGHSVASKWTAEESLNSSGRRGKVEEGRKRVDVDG